MVMMTAQSDNIPSVPLTRALRTAFVVSRSANPRVLETVADAGNFDVVVVESTARAYSRIKHVAPTLVIVCVGMDDPEAFQVLSMLALDRDTAHIPVLTCTTLGSDDDAAEEVERLPAAILH